MGRGREQMNNGVQVLIDSDAFIGWMIEADTHHQQTVQIFNHLVAEQVKFATTSLVVGEAATVLSHRKGQELARTFLDEVIEKGKFLVIYITEALHQEALNIFKEQTKKGTSVVDCANVAVIRQFCIPRIFSFDKVYPNKFGVKFAGS
jgi:predicted nucleic acid-binding protein